MHKLIGNHWQKTIWKIVTNPAVEVLAAIVVVMLAAWLVVQTELDQRQPAEQQVPFRFGH